MRLLLALLLLLPSLAHAAVSRDANGWTVITPSGDSRIIYVDSARPDDTGDGLSEATAKKTISAGATLLRSGFPDHLLLKKGSTFIGANGAGSGLDWPGTGGRSATEPQMLGTYGTGARPIIKPGNNASCITNGGGDVSSSYVAIMGIDCYAAYRDPGSGEFIQADSCPSGISMAASAPPATWLLIEDVVVRFWCVGLNLTAGSPRSNTVGIIRRNQFLNAWSTASHANGMLCHRFNDVLFEENLFDHNGWGASREGGQGAGGATIFNHNIYLQYAETVFPIEACVGAVVRGNISANASSHGIQMRAGGVMLNNLFIDNPINILASATSLIPSRGEVSYNVLDGAADISSVTARGTAMSTTGITGAPPNLTHHNLSLNDGTSSTNDHGLSIACLVEDQLSNGTCDGDTITNNVWYNWGEGCPIQGAGTSINQTKENNFYSDVPTLCTVSGTNLNSATFSWPDATRDVATYAASIGLTGTKAAFLTAARGQSKDNWDPRYTAAAANAWIRAGFGIPEPPKPPIRDARLGGVVLR